MVRAITCQERGVQPRVESKGENHKTIWKRLFVRNVVRTQQIFNGVPRQVALVVKNLPAKVKTWEAQIRPLGQEDLLEKGTAAHASIFPWRLPWTGEPGVLRSIESQRVGHDWSNWAQNRQYWKAIMSHHAMWAGKIVGDCGQWVGCSPTVTVDFTLSVSQFSCSVVSNSWRPHGVQHARPPYPSPIPSDESNESALRIRWPKYWSFSFNISSSNEHPGLSSFRMDWLDLLAV